jgi:hypothetical protein
MDGGGCVCEKPRRRQLTPVKSIFGSAGKMAGHCRMPGTASELKHVLMERGDGDRIDSIDPGIWITYEHTNVILPSQLHLSIDSFSFYQED